MEHFNIKFCDRTANIYLPSVQQCCLNNFGSFAASGPHATTFSSSSCHGCLRLHLIAVFVYIFASSLSSSTFFLVTVFLYVFASSLFSSTSSPSSPSCHLGRLRLHLRLRLCFIVILAVFVCHNLVAFALHIRISPWIVALVLFYFAL
ncbi:hypothetical protein OUZ56_002297 [Daphnia magna]|uniref:Transmembrane protein n=1 Tax=Daphnia magna TaxID=35525 RepID=A0ABR0A591_9CRUS|nr:hypothetical protein OUZ56_002297 [Daphnia magna]